METLLIILAVLFSVVGIAGCILPGLPGTILNYGALLCAYFVAESEISTTQLVIWGLLTAVVLVADYLLPIYTTKWLGGSKASATGAIVGLFAGILFTPIGMILGSFLGAVIGELIHDSSDFNRALKAGIGSFLAFIFGTGLKLIVSIWLSVIVLLDLFF